MAGVPDALGGIGYSNVFKGNKAIDDLREDIRYNRVRKLKEDEAKKAAADKLAERNLIGWASTDQKEFDRLYQKIQEDAAKYGVTPEVKLTMQKALGLAEASKKAEDYYNKSLTYLNQHQKDLDPDEFSKAVTDLENWRTQGGKMGEVGTTWQRAQSTPPTMPELQTDWLPKSQALVDKTKADITQIWKPGENISEEKKTYAKETIDANWNDYRSSDYYKAQAKQYAKEKGEKDQEKINEALKQRYIDKLPSYVKERFSRPPEDDGSGASDSGYKPVIAKSGDASKAELTKPQKSGDSIIDEALIKLGWKEADVMPSNLETKVVSKEKLLLTGTKGKEPQMLSFKTRDLNGNDIDTFRPYEVRKTPKGYVVTGRAKITEYDDEGNNKGQKEQDEAILLEDGLNKEDFEIIFLKGSEHETLDEWWDSVKPEKGGVQEFKINGKTYKIPESEVADFKKDMGL